MVLSKNSAEVLYVKKRRGVFDLAKKLGNIPIIPVWAFGTTKHFSRWPDENESVAYLSVVRVKLVQFLVVVLVMLIVLLLLMVMVTMGRC